MSEPNPSLPPIPLIPLCFPKVTSEVPIPTGDLLPVFQTAEALLAGLRQMSDAEQLRFWGLMLRDRTTWPGCRLQDLLQLQHDTTLDWLRAERRADRARRTKNVNVDKVRRSYQLQQDEPKRPLKSIAKELGWTLTKLLTYRTRYWRDAPPPPDSHS